MGNGKVSNDVFNLGNSSGYSIKEIIQVLESISDNPAVIKYENRRPGNLAVAVTAPAFFFPQYSCNAKEQTKWKKRLKT